MKCPFVYANGKNCKGYVESLKIVKPNVIVTLNENGKVIGISIEPKYHVHLKCSEKDNHAGCMSPDSEQMKIWYNDLPEDLRKQIEWSKKQ